MLRARKCVCMPVCVCMRACVFERVRAWTGIPVFPRGTEVWTTGQRAFQEGELLALFRYPTRSQCRKCEFCIAGNFFFFFSPPFLHEFKIFLQRVENSCSVRQQFTVYIPGTRGSGKLRFSSSDTSVSRRLLIIKASVSWGMCFRTEKQIWSHGLERLKPKKQERILIWWWIELEEQREWVSKMSSSLLKGLFFPPIPLILIWGISKFPLALCLGRRPGIVFVLLHSGGAPECPSCSIRIISNHRYSNWLPLQNNG